MVDLGSQLTTQAARWSLAPIMAHAPVSSTIEAVTVMDGGWAGVTADDELAFWAPAGEAVRRVRVLLLAPDTSYRLVDARIACGHGLHPYGFGEGDAYVLPRDAYGWSVCEPGANHRLLYVSPAGSGVADGLTEATKVTPARAGAIMAAAGISDQVLNSWHVLLERGYAYRLWDGARTQPRFGSGEDALHPMVFSAFGTGARPIIDATWTPDKSQRLVLRDLNFGVDPVRAAAEGVNYQSGNYRVVVGNTFPCGDHLLENVRMEPVESHGVVQAGGLKLNRPYRFTFYRNIGVDARKLKPKTAYDPLNPTTTGWAKGYDDRMQWVFFNHIDGAWIEDCMLDHNGWVEGYTDAKDSPVQPPTPVSHNIYMATPNRDVTVRGLLSHRASSVGAQFRAGAIIKNSVFSENNVGVNSLAGNEENRLAGGQRHELRDVLVMHPSNKLNLSKNGYARGWGYDMRGETSMVDCIAADDRTGTNDTPDGVKDGLLFKDFASAPVTPDVELDRVTVWNWGSDANQIPAELADVSDSARFAASLDAFAKDHLADPDATWTDVVLALRALDRDTWPTALAMSEVVAWVQAGYGYTPASLSPGRTARFRGATPNSLRNGKRWDDRMMWSDETAPRDGDSVDLDGWRVIYDKMTRTVPSFAFGRGGRLDISGGKLVASAVSAGNLGGSVLVDVAGWLSLPGWSGANPLEAEVRSGRLSFEAAVSGGLDLTVAGGELLLPGAADVTLAAGSVLTLRAGKAGWDAASGTSALIVAGGEVRWVIPATGAAVSLKPFRSGRNGLTEPGGTRTLTLTSGILAVDLAAVTGPGTWTLAEPGAISGALGNMTILYLNQPAALTPSLVITLNVLTLTVI